MLKIYRKMAGDDGEDCISMKYQLASVYYHSDRLNEAEILGLEIFETRSRLGGEEDQGTLDAMVCNLSPLLEVR